MLAQSTSAETDAHLQAGSYLGSQVEGVVFACLKPGDLLVVPPGWACARAALSPAVSIAWQLLPATALQPQLEVSRVLCAPHPAAAVPPAHMLVCPPGLPTLTANASLAASITWPRMLATALQQQLGSLLCVKAPASLHPHILVRFLVFETCC